MLLVQIGQGLTERAEASHDDKDIEQLIADTETTLELANNTKYVPEKIRNGPAFAGIGEKLGVIRMRQARDSRLAATLAKMDEAIAGGDAAAAYAARSDCWLTTRRSRTTRPSSKKCGQLRRPSRLA